MLISSYIFILDITKCVVAIAATHFVKLTDRLFVALVNFRPINNIPPSF